MITIRVFIPPITQSGINSISIISVKKGRKEGREEGREEGSVLKVMNRAGIMRGRGRLSSSEAT